MKRRRFVKALATAPAAAPLLAAQQAAAPNNNPRPTSPAPPPLDATTPPAPLNRTVPAAAELPTLEFGTADEVADMKPKYFTATQFATLTRLSEVLMPSIKDAPGAKEARAAEFLDFLLSESPKERQQIYRTGLDLLESGAKKRFSKAFASVSTSEAATLLEPLKASWTYEDPSDPLAHFLRVAKRDVRTATLNSREYSVAMENAGGRRGAGVGLYWFPLG